MSKARFEEKVRLQKTIDASSLQLKEHVVAVNRVTKVVKGGKNLSFSALVVGKYSASQVLLKPAPEGTGVIAGGPVRPVIEAVGIQNVFTKAIGNTNPHNVVKATLDALLQLKNREAVAALRGKNVQEL